MALVNEWLKLRQGACVEDIDWRAPRGIDRAVFARLVVGDWIDRNENLLVTGATGLGKSWIACALGHKACRDNRSVQYHRVPRLFEALALARGDGRFGRLLKTIGRVQLLILDDWGLSVLNASERRDLLEILDDRHGRASTIVTSQIPVEHWHDIIGDPTLGGPRGRQTRTDLIWRKNGSRDCSSNGCAIACSTARCFLLKRQGHVQALCTVRGPVLSASHDGSGKYGQKCGGSFGTRRITLCCIH